MAVRLLLVQHDDFSCPNSQNGRHKAVPVRLLYSFQSQYNRTSRECSGKGGDLRCQVVGGSFDWEKVRNRPAKSLYLFVQKVRERCGIYVNLANQLSRDIA